jgi:hypothetical protein
MNLLLREDTAEPSAENAESRYFSMSLTIEKILI